MSLPSVHASPLVWVMATVTRIVTMPGAGTMGETVPFPVVPVTQIFLEMASVMASATWPPASMTLETAIVRGISH